jgi:transposase-like protein
MVSEAGRRISEVARDLELDPKLIRRWREALIQEKEQKVAEAFPGKGRLQPEPQELRRLQRENTRPAPVSMGARLGTPRRLRRQVQDLDRRRGAVSGGWGDEDLLGPSRSHFPR